MAGIFSLMAYTVSLRTHEIRIRMALGARLEDILAIVLVKGARLALAEPRRPDGPHEWGEHV